MCVQSQLSRVKREYPALLILFEYGGSKQMAEQENIFRAHLHVATFCEKVLREADGVMSLIRMVDRFNVFGDTEEMAPVVLSFMVYISFKSGILRGKQRIALRPKSPTGKDLPAMEFPVLFEGDDDRGPAMGFQVNWPIEEEGLFWWDLYLNEELVTRMPLRVTYQRMRTPIPGA
jgi:hypothetical protein